MKMTPSEMQTVDVADLLFFILRDEVGIEHLLSIHASRSNDDAYYISRAYVNPSSDRAAVGYRFDPTGTLAPKRIDELAKLVSSARLPFTREYSEPSSKGIQYPRLVFVRSDLITWFNARQLAKASVGNKLLIVPTYNYWREAIGAALINLEVAQRTQAERTHPSERPYHEFAARVSALYHDWLES